MSLLVVQGSLDFTVNGTLKRYNTAVSDGDELRVSKSGTGPPKFVQGS